MHKTLAPVAATTPSKKTALDFRQLFSLGDRLTTNIRTRRGPFGCDYFKPHRQPDPVHSFKTLDANAFNISSGHVSDCAAVGQLLQNQRFGSDGPLATDTTKNVFLLAHQKNKGHIWIGLSYVSAQWEIDSGVYGQDTSLDEGSRLFIPG